MRLFLASLVQSIGGIIGRKPKPAVPAPFKPKPSDSKNGESGSSGKVVPQGRVLERTKSLEDLLSGDNARRKNNSSPKPSSEEPVIVKKHNDYDHLDISNQSTSFSNPSSPSNIKKSDLSFGRKQHHKAMLSNSPSSPAEFRKINSPPTNDFTDGGSAPPLPQPNFSPSHHSKGSFIPKTYLAIESYESQAPGCLSFNAGDKCSLIRQSNGGWWYVNIGGVEGWTPGEFWQENSRVSFDCYDNLVLIKFLTFL